MFKFKGVAASYPAAANSMAVELADSDFLGYGSGIPGVCLPNYAPTSPWATALNRHNGSMGGGSWRGRGRGVGGVAAWEGSRRGGSRGVGGVA